MSDPFVGHLFGRGEDAIVFNLYVQENLIGLNQGTLTFKLKNRNDI